MLADASPGSGLGTSVLSASLFLSVPSAVPACPYSGSLTITDLLPGPWPAGNWPCTRAAMPGLGGLVAARRTVCP